MYEILVEVGDGQYMTFDIAHTQADAEMRAARLQKQKKNTRIVDRDYKKPPRERFERRGGRDE
jgi:hypothetical protein